MAGRKKNSDINKSEEVRKALNEYPDMPPSELARRLSEEHKTTFSPSLVSTIKTKFMRSRESTEPQPSVAAQGNGPVASAGAAGVAGMVANLQAYIEQIGKTDLKQLVDTL